jgi:hypothetical protein
VKIRWSCREPSAFRFAVARSQPIFISTRRNSVPSRLSACYAWRLAGRSSAPPRQASSGASRRRYNRCFYAKEAYWNPHRRRRRSRA